MKRVVATVQDRETEEIFTVNGDRLAYSIPHLRNELAKEPFVSYDVPFNSIWKSSLHELCGEGMWNYLVCLRLSLCMTLGLRPFLYNVDWPRALGKSNLRRNRYPDCAYFFIHVEKWRLQRNPASGMPKSQ